MADSSPTRIWYQSFVHPIEQAPYIERLQAALDKAASPGIKFEAHGLDPPDHYFHPLTEFRCAAQVIRNAIEAERAPSVTLVTHCERSRQQFAPPTSVVSSQRCCM